MPIDHRTVMEFTFPADLYGMPPVRPPYETDLKIALWAMALIFALAMAHVAAVLR